MGKERQKHGFTYQDAIIEKYALVPDPLYTAKHDAFCGDYPVQVKSIKHGGAIELGDYKRNKTRTQDFILMIGFWKGSKNNIIEEYILHVDVAEFVQHLQYEFDEEIEIGMKQISNSRDDDANWKQFCKTHKERWPSSNLIDIRFKRDHKTQKRVQCAISWNNFKNHFLPKFKKLNDIDLKTMQAMQVMHNNTPQTTGLNRSTRDEYFTKPELANHFVDVVCDKIRPKNDDLFVEPSAGNGAFLDALATRSVVAYDILSRRRDITEHDFLRVDHTLFNGINCHAIGNPPFGRQSSLAKQFIQKCALFCSSISFILPKSFKKDSFQAAFPLHFHLIHEEDCPSNAFIVDGKEHDVPCVFQIWVKKTVPRTAPKKEEPLLYTFVTKQQSPHISFRRVGVNAGEIDTNIDDKCTQSHNFVRFDASVDVDEFIRSYSTAMFQHNNTVGPRSIAKTEAVAVFNSVVRTLFNP